MSNEAVNRIAKSLGERNWLGNQRSSLAALDEMVLGLGRSREAALSQVNNGPGSAQYAPAPLPGQDSTYGASPAAPEPGTVEEGYRFLGGDPKDPNSWEAVQ